MRRPLRARPVVVACRGCERSRAAAAVAEALDRQGLAEAGAGELKARSRFPVYAIEGCAERCAGRWLGEVRAKVEASFILEPGREPAEEAGRIAAALGADATR